MKNLLKHLSLPGLAFIVVGIGLLGYLLHAQFVVSSISKEYQFGKLEPGYYLDENDNQGIEDIMDEVSKNIEGGEHSAAVSGDGQDASLEEVKTQLQKKRLVYLKDQLEKQGLYMPANPEPSTWEGDSENPKIFARMIIPRIELVAPVTEGVENNDIKLAVGHIPGTRRPGEMGNSAYAGHRSHTYGRFFNRLGEMEIGDTIIIETTEYKYTYKIFERFVVNPDEVWVTQDIPGKATLTLVTCEPLYGNSHRLIVRGILQ